MRATLRSAGALARPRVFPLGNPAPGRSVAALMPVFSRLVLPALLLALAAPRAAAEITLAPLFTDGAVLQRDKRVPVWGRAEAGEKVTVSFAGQRREATPDADGRWLVILEPLAATTQGAELTVVGQNTIVLRDVVVGEVWLASGQSNMEWPVSRAAEAVAEIAAANFPLLRHVKIERTVAETPADSVKTAGWQRATPQTAGAFSAVGYFFARDLHQKLGVPVGLINSSWGGTPVEAWMSPAALAGDPRFAIVAERWRKNLEDYPAAKSAYDARLAAWTQAATAAQAQGKPAHDAFLKKNLRPRAPRGPGDPWTPSGLFNGMINPLLPCALRGAIWYQGESNAERAAEYHPLFAAMITAWRAHFGQGDFPFYWVSLANYAVPADGGERGRSYAFLREAQTQTLALPNTGQALAIDLGDPKDIHPTNKQDVGRRLARLARHRVYGQVTDDTGPSFAGAAREGAAIRVRFTHATGGLVAHDKPVQSLEIAGADRVFHPAEGRIERDTLVVKSAAVREPVAVRYAWINSPEANLYNGAGLPAVPFRTDAW
jgi:sialate O-acetylesterase